MKNIYKSLGLIILGLALHLYFRDTNKMTGLTTLIVGLAFLINYLKEYSKKKR